MASTSPRSARAVARSFTRLLASGVDALVLVVWEPIYVACGFSLYLNRRTVLEAWDIELVFRRMRQRLVGASAVL